MSVRRTGAGLLAGAALLALTGCSLSVGDRDEEPATSGADASPDGRPGDGASHEPATTVDGPSPEELSAELLDDAEAAAGRPAAGSVSGELGGEPATMEVVEVRRTGGAVVAELRMTADEPGAEVSVAVFGSPRFASADFIRTLSLDDPVGGTRYLPLTFDDGRDACACPYLPLVLGPVPQTVYAAYPPLPETVTEVDVNLGGVLVVPDVAVEDAPGTTG
jgi:hypothetical protein